MSLDGMRRLTRSSPARSRGGFAHRGLNRIGAKRPVAPRASRLNDATAGNDGTLASR